LSGLSGLAEFLEDLHSRWQPHPGQIPIGRALFYEGCKNIFTEAGKNFGKTELSCYCTWRWAFEHPGSENYIIEPYSIQAKEILWAGKRIQTFGNPDLVESANDTEMRIRFKNGSFIKLLGSDNEVALQGIKPQGLIVYDEIKDIKKSAINLMEPNRAAFGVPALFIGTPPEFHTYSVDLSNMAKKSQYWRYFHAPTSSNPHISKQWLKEKKEELISMNDEETWLRDYEAIFIKGGKRHIYPQAIKYKPRPKAELIPQSFKGISCLVIFDPAAASTFGVLFVLFDQYSRRSIVFDEIYEQDQSLMTVSRIWQRVFEILEPLKSKGLREIRYVYDEAETWFLNETEEKPQCKDIWLEPTKKALNDKEFGITLVREIFNKGMIEIAEECVKLLWEFQNYMKDENGRIPKKDDHLLDCVRYYCHAVGYSLEEVPKPKEAAPQTQIRGERLDVEMFLDSNSELEMDFASSYEEI